MPEYSVVGKRLPRIDGLVKVTGQATYAADLVLPGMLYGKVLRSPYAHARIINIDTSKAERLPGVRAVVTGKDFPGIAFGHMPFSRDQLPLARDKVRHVGEGVAAVAAIDEDTAEEARELIEVEYEELPAVFTAEEAMKEGAPLIHDRKERNILFEAHYHWGDVEKGFQESDYIREERFQTQRATAGFIEPHAVLASADASGRITLQASKQSPYITWRHFCRAMDLPLSKVRIINPYVGGGFSGKHEPFDLDFVAARLSQKTQRPVKIVLNQDEVLAFFKQRQHKDALVKIGAKKDGTLMAYQCTVLAEGGAYANQTPFELWIFCNYTNFPYRLPHLKFDATRVYTNNIPSGTIYGHGGLAGRYVYESMLSIVADDLGIDQLEFRLKNALREGDTTAHGQAVDFVTVDQALKQVAEGIKWEEHKANRKPYQGIGFSAVIHSPGTRMGGHHSSTSLVKVVEDGTISLITGCTELGQGCDTIMAQIAAEVLGLRLEDVTVAIEDSDGAVLEAGMFGGRGTPIGGVSMMKAAEDARRQLAEMAAKELETQPENLEFRDRGIYIKGQPEQAMSFQDAARLAYYKNGVPVYGRGYYHIPDVEIHDLYGGGGGRSAKGWASAAHAAKVEVDPETGHVKILKSVGAVDCGQPLNPLLLDGQEEGSMAFAYGLALFEDTKIDEKGRPLIRSLTDYRLPTSAEGIDHTSIHISNPSPYGAFGAKSGGEIFSLLGTVTIANAVADAIGVRITDIPLTPEKILQALKEKKGKEGA